MSAALKDSAAKTLEGYPEDIKVCARHPCTRLQTTRQLTSHPNGQNCLLDGENAPEAPVKEIKEKWRLLPAFLQVHAQRSGWLGGAA